MTDFAELQARLGLKRFTVSPLGTLYFVPYAPGAPRLIVRRFDAELPPEYAPVYADLVLACQRWIGRHPSVDALARVEAPTSVGADHVTRPHRTFTSTAEYAGGQAPGGDDTGVEPPDEWLRLRAAVDAVPAPVDDRDAVLAAVIRRSLREPSGKTYFDADEARFVVIDPRSTVAEVRRWADLA